MSRFTEFVRAKFGRTPQETAGDIAKRLLGEHYGDIRTLAEQMIVALDHNPGDVNADGTINKAGIVRTVLVGALSSVGLGGKVPAWILNWLIEDIVQSLRTREVGSVPVS